MEHPYLVFVKLFELVGMGNFAEAYPHVIYSWVAMIILIGLGFLSSRRINLVPSKLQNFIEVVILSIEAYVVDFGGEEGRGFFPIVATIFLYIFISNLMGLVPGFFPPTASVNTPLSCALVVFVVTHAIGINYHGVGYIRHFLGPVWWLSPLMFPIEVIKHFAVILSLTFRLFGNMMGHELVLGILFMMAGLYLLPLPIMTLGVLVALVQAFVFFLLSITYFSAAMDEAH